MPEYKKVKVGSPEWEEYVLAQREISAQDRRALPKRHQKKYKPGLPGWYKKQYKDWDLLADGINENWAGWPIFKWVFIVFIVIVILSEIFPPKI